MIARHDLEMMQIEGRLSLLNKKLATHGRSLLYIRVGGSKYGVSAGYAHNVTGLLSKKELYAWLCAFEDGVDYIGGSIDNTNDAATL